MLSTCHTQLMFREFIILILFREVDNNNDDNDDNNKAPPRALFACRLSLPPFQNHPGRALCSLHQGSVVMEPRSVVLLPI
jgi:hypothetical protein